MSTSDNEKYLKENFTINGVIATIAHIENDSSLSPSENLVLRRRYTHQVVVGSDNFYYKVYEVNKYGDNFLDHLVRSALQKVYQDLGLHWEMISFERDGTLFDFEQRQILHVANPKDDGPFENILLSFSKLLDQVEEMLRLDRILKKLHEYPEFSQVKHVKLSRYVINKYNDYAVFDGQAILLDDAEFCIEFLNENSEVLEVSLPNNFEIDIFGNTYEFNKITDDIFYAWSLNAVREQNVAMVKHNENFTSQLLSDVDSIIKMSVEVVGNDALKTDCKIDGVDATDLVGTVLVSDLTDPVEAHLYAEIDELMEKGEKVSLQTSFNEKGTVLSEEFVIWAAHMKTIGTYYPEVSKLTTIFLTQEFCEACLKGKFDASDFKGRYGTTIKYVAPTMSDTFPKRNTFRKFLLTLTKTSPDVFDLMLKEERKSHEGGDRHYNCYCDYSGCMLCDYEQVSQLSQ